MCVCVCVCVHACVCACVCMRPCTCVYTYCTYMIMYTYNHYMYTYSHTRHVHPMAPLLTHSWSHRQLLADHQQFHLIGSSSSGSVIEGCLVAAKDGIAEVTVIGEMEFGEVGCFSSWRSQGYAFGRNPFHFQRKYLREKGNNA